MRHVEIGWPATTLPSLLAALTTWVTLWSWAGFVESPSGYLAPTLGALVVLAATGILLRAARVGPLLVVVAQLAVMAVWLTHAWASGTALGGWLPTPASVREVLDELGMGMAAARAYHAPVSDSVPQILPLLVGTGVLVGVLVDFLACGLRRAPLAGLPLLAAYTAPVSILPGGVPWWVFGATAVSFLALLATEEGQRLLSWGRRVPRGDAVHDTGGGAVSTESLRSSARRIGLTATGLALVAPVVIPTFDGFLPGDGPGGAGEGGTVDIANPLVNLRRDLVRGRDTDLVFVTTDDPDPSYLRISVLDSFNGRTWAPSNRDIPPEQRADGVVSRPPGLGAEPPRRRVQYRVEVSGAFRSTWLPTPYPVTSIEAPGDWRYDADTLDFMSAEGETTAGISYALTALDVTPRSEDLLAAPSPPEAVFTPYTDLPDELPTRVRDLAREVANGFDTKFEKAVALQRWFRQDGGFEYSLAPGPGTGTDDLVAFLTDRPGGRVGYCEQFAAAMAVMGRALGIPSRVAVGFLRPDKVGPDEFVYSAHDLHAWPEMYFDGVGWVRFEPTPDDRASSVPGYTAGELGGPQATQLPSASAATPTSQNTPRDPRDLDPGAAGAGGSSGGRGPWPWLLVALTSAVLLVGPRAARAAVRSRRWGTARTAVEAAEAGWAELRDTALDLRIPWNDSVTLRTIARALERRFGRAGAAGQDGFVRGAARGTAANPEAVEALERLVRDVERARFARTGATGRGAEEVATDVNTCREALVAGATDRRRRLATWLPVSLVRNGVWRAVPLRASAGEPTLEVGVDRAT